MTDLPYTDNDTRAEAARQYAEVLRAPDRLEVQDEMQGKPIPSRPDVLWQQTGVDHFHDAASEVHELLNNVPDMSRWAIDLGASHLVRTTPLAWGHGDNWSLAVQVAHRPGISDDLHQSLINIVRGAVQLFLDNRGLDLPQTL